MKNEFAFGEHHVSIDCAPTEAVTRKDFTLTTTDGLTLTGRAWAPQRARGVIAWLHGYAEHRGRYEHVGQWLAARGYAVAVVELRGHGESDGERGYVKNFDEYFQDVTALLKYCNETWPNTKIVLGAHSLGSLIATRYIEENISPVDISACIFSSTFARLTTPLPLWKNIFGKIAGAFFPKVALPTNIEAQTLTHDDRIARDYTQHPLVFKTGTAGWYRATLINQQLALAQASHIHLPMLMLHGLDDPLASPHHARQLYEKIASKDKQWKAYPGLYHELLNELEWEHVYADICAWLNARVG